MKRLLIALAFVAPIAASAGEYHTVEWFRDHPDARKQTVFWCRNNAGLARHEPNCVNAENGALLAEERAMANSDRNPAKWRVVAPGFEPMWLNTCKVLRDKGTVAAPAVAEACREVRAPGY